MNVKKQAARDAAEFARAQMFYGEGAGTRRKLINSAVNYKISVVPGYAEAYRSAMARQDMAKHASKAVSERTRKDISKKVSRNVRGLVKGNRQSLTTGVAIVVVVGTWAHNEGHDEKAIAYVKSKATQAKYAVERANMRRKVKKMAEGR